MVIIHSSYPDKMLNHHTPKKKVRIEGTKYRNNVPNVSSGVSSLDYLIGGGLPTGTIVLVEQDILGSYGRVINKYYLAEGVVNKQALLVASADENPKNILEELPIPTVCEDDDRNKSSGDDKMSIAWRYEGLGPVESSFSSNLNFGRNFDLSRHISQSTVKECSTTLWSKRNTDNKFKGFQNALYGDLLATINEAVKMKEFQYSNERQNVLRICLMGLGSPIWTALRLSENSRNEEGKDLIKFLYLLRILVRESNALALVSVPSNLFQNESTVKRLRHSAHVAIKLESFAGSDKETNPVFKDYHGLFHILKLSSHHSLAPHVPPSHDLAFKLRRKKFVIEKLHLPPELQESKEREQDDIVSSTPSCGSFNKRNIDF